jgi:hypothetical protein
MYGLGGRPEYSALAKLGDKVWAKVIDPLLLVVLGKDEGARRFSAETRPPLRH